MLLSLLKHINPEAQETNPQLDIQPSPVQTPQGNSNMIIDNPDHVTLENMPELSILSNLANLGDLTALVDPETLSSLSTLIGADGSLNLDLKSLTTPQNAPLDLGLNTLGDLNLDAIVSLLNQNNNQLDLQDPNLLTELSKSFNLSDLPSLIVPQDQNINGNQQGLNMQENNQNSGQGQQRYANNSNSMNSMNNMNNKRRNGFPNGFPQQSVRRSPQRYKGRGYQQDYEDTINFNNNPMDQRGPWSNSNSNSNNYNNSRNMQFFNKRNYSSNSNNVSYDESNQYNNNNNRKRRCPDHFD
jgi:hypothetical protein